MLCFWLWLCLTWYWTQNISLISELQYIKWLSMVVKKKEMKRWAQNRKGGTLKQSLFCLVNAPPFIRACFFFCVSNTVHAWIIDFLQIKTAGRLCALAYWQNWNPGSLCLALCRFEDQSFYCAPPGPEGSKQTRGSVFFPKHFSFQFPYFCPPKGTASKKTTVLW